jgi:hypothetical protein
MVGSQAGLQTDKPPGVYDEGPRAFLRRAPYLAEGGGRVGRGGPPRGVKPPDPPRGAYNISMAPHILG